ncbi:hypothetical protein QQF64_001658 [Cirrhinus molitorella]|uniref:Uncharacterized protein n=2 Tax=Cirrhinus molitorella TaxID=172907 RepID=A0ABR3P0Q6_9TELE
MAHNRKQQELSPLASPIKKKSKPPTSIDMVDKMANTVAHFEDILKTELTVMRNEFASHMSVVQSLCSKLDLLTGEMREQKKVVADHDRRVTALEQQVVDLQDRSRRSNLRLIGLPEGAEKDDPVGFLKRSLPTWLPSLAGKEIEVERAHRVYTRMSSDRAKPRVFLFKLLRYMDRELILRAARLHAPVKSSDGATLSFFPDFSPVTAKRRSAFASVRKEMREVGIQNFLLYPATLKVILNQGEPKMLYSPEEARVFLRSLSPTNCILDLPRLSDSDSEYLAEQITLQELESAIRSMNKGKSPGIDGEYILVGRKDTVSPTAFFTSSPSE